MYTNSGVGGNPVVRRHEEFWWKHGSTAGLSQIALRGQSSSSVSVFGGCVCDLRLSGVHSCSCCGRSFIFCNTQPCHRKIRVSIRTYDFLQPALNAFNNCIHWLHMMKGVVWGGVSVVQCGQWGGAGGGPHHDG